MTHLPLEDRSVVGTAGPRYEPKSICAHPFCNETTGLEKHHLWRRSFLGGGFNWVVLPGGRHVGNVVKLCLKHHQEITENKARIVWYAPDPESLCAFFWDEPNGTTFLDPQPPLGFTDFPEEGVDDISENAGATQHEHSVLTPDDNGVPEGTECPTCNRRVPKKRKPSTPTSKVHSFRLPLDQTDELEEIWEAVAKHLGVQENSYYKGEAVLRAFVIALQGPAGG